MIEREDNYYELTRKFRIDETVAFKGEKIEHPKFTEEMTIIEELGVFFLTNQRLVYIGKKNAFHIPLNVLSSADFDGINIVTFHHTDGTDSIFKFSDEAAGVLYILFERTLKAAKA